MKGNLLRLKKLRVLLLLTGAIAFSNAGLGQTVLAKWDFPNDPDNAVCDDGIAANSAKIITLVNTNASIEFSRNGQTTNCASGLRWDNGSGVKSFVFNDIVTTGYFSITLSIVMKGNNNNSPRDFKIQYRFNNGAWTDVGSAISLTTTWASVATNLALPNALNQSDVDIRIIQTSNTPLDGSGNIGTGAQAWVGIDNIVIAGLGPVVSASPSSSTFGDVCLNTTTGAQSFTITGTNLTTANITVGALTGYTFSTTSGGTYTSSLNLTQSGGDYSQTIYVKFTPTSVQSYDGDVVVGGGGATSVNVATSGTGITVSNPANTPSPSDAATGVCYAGSGAVSSVSWDAVADATSYDVYFGAGSLPGTVTTNVTTNSYSSGTLLTNTTYYWKVVPKNSCGDATGSGTWMFTTAGTSCISYCSAGATTCDEYISRVQLGSIDNNTSCTSGGYADYSAQSTNLTIGTGYPITITNGNPYFDGQDRCGIWIDWNQDGDFSDTDETITVTGTPGIGPYSATVTPPGGVATGSTRLRIRINWNANLDPCNDSSYGEVEDYTINVIPACTPPTVYSVSGGGSYCSGGTGVNINLSGSESGVNYELYNDGVATGTIQPGDGSALTFSGVTATGTYTLVATKTSDGCVSTMTGSATVTLASGVSDFTGLITNSSCPSAADGSIVIHNIADPAVEFVNADQDYIDLGSTLLSNRSAFTLEGWVKFNKTDLGSRMSLFGQNDAIEFGFSNSTTIMCWSASGGSASAPITAYPDDNGWHHVAAVGNGTNILIYIDGIQEGTGGSTTSNYGNDASYSSKIGGGVWDPSGGSFSGQIKKVGYWSVALTPAQLATLTSGFDFYTGSETDLLAGYNFYEGSGTSIASVTPGPTGTFANTPAWVDVVSYSWIKTGDGSFTRSTKNSSGLTSGEYNLTVSNGSCSKSNSFTVNSDNPATAISSQSTAGQSQCEGGSFSAISITASGTGLSYQWYSNPVASNSGGTSLGSANGAQTANYTPQVASPGTTYYYCIVSGTCGTATSLVSGAFEVNALPNPTFIVSPGSGICASDDVTYTTQSNQFNYSWSVSGIENIDYSITSGGVGSANSTVTLKWLTTGSKTITVNYTDATGCTGETNATSTVTVDPLPTPGEIIPD